MNFSLKVWRQKDGGSPGSFKDYDAKDIPSEASFLEMLDIVNEVLNGGGEDPIAFDSDCREGICGMCSLVINGIPHGPGKAKTTCQLYMRRFKDGDTIWIEPFRAAAFPTVKDLVVDRSAFDRIITSSFEPDPPRKQTTYRCPSITRTLLWKPPRVSDAAPV